MPLRRQAQNATSFALPIRLRRISSSASRLLRAAWYLIFAFALIVDLASLFYTLKDVRQFRPALTEVGLEYQFGDAGDVLIGTIPDAHGVQKVPIDSHVIAIAGQPVPPDARVSEIAGRIERAEGPAVSVDLKKGDGTVVHLVQPRSNVPVEPSHERARDIRFGAITGAGIFACAVLLLCSFLLVWRRPHDPVAMLFAFAFVLMAATVDPALRLWMGLGYMRVLDILAGCWIYVLVVGFAAFPDGVFVPRQFRWLIVTGLILPLLYSLVPYISESIPDVLAAPLMLLVIAAQAIRFKRVGAGVERQQIKWTAFGFGVGLTLIFISQVVNVFFIPLDPAQQKLWVNIGMLFAFSLGIAAIPLGLLVALTRYRLWEADAVISRSVAYAVVTIFVGIVWAASSDLVKLIIAEVMGQQSGALSTMVGAALAAVIFGATQSLVLDWTRQRFGNRLDQIGKAGERLKIWALTETPHQVGARAFGIIENIAKPRAAAIVFDRDATGEIIASYGIESSDQPQLTQTFPIEDEEGAVGRLLLDMKSRDPLKPDEAAAIHRLMPALAQSLRAAHGRHAYESSLQQQLEAMAARLAKLEGSANPA